jgi:Ino eighty subunit 2
VVIESDSDEDGDDVNDKDVEMDEEEDEEDAEGEDEDMGLADEEDAEGDDDEDAEGEDEDAEGEEDIEVAPPAARRQAAAAAAAAAAKPTVTVTPAPIARVQSVESKEMQMASTVTTDDEELSELPSEGMPSAGEEGDEDEEMGEDDELDADGETDEEGVDMATPGSRDSTPDVSKMTKRQRGRLDQVMGNDFLQLPMGSSTCNPVPLSLELTSAI